MVTSRSGVMSRPLFVYVKKQHVGVVPGIAEFVAEYVSDKALGEDGYLGAKGLITLPGALFLGFVAIMPFLIGEILKGFGISTASSSASASGSAPRRSRRSRGRSPAGHLSIVMVGPMS